MAYAGKTAGGGIGLILETLPGIPGNGIAIPGQELTGGQIMFLAMIPPEPRDGKKETVDHLIGKFIQPHASSEEQIAEVREMLKLYDGLEPDMIFCLSYALQGGRFEKAASRFRVFYNNSLSKRELPNWMRCTSETTFKFFDRMYRSVEAEKYR